MKCVSIYHISETVMTFIVVNTFFLVQADTFQGQLRLKKASVLIIGAGGLGCPAAAYLSGAGIGRLGLVDGDVVEMSNLHRQILHSTSRIGMKKVDSAIAYLHS